MKTYKVYTKWIGYSEIIVDAENEQEALRQLNGLIESIATGNNTYKLDTFKSDVEEVLEEVSDVS